MKEIINRYCGNCFDAKSLKLKPHLESDNYLEILFCMCYWDN